MHKTLEVPGKNLTVGNHTRHSSIFSLIRNTCGEVAEAAQYVRLDTQRIASYAESLPLDRLRSPEHHPERHFLGQGEHTAAYFLTLDAINFGSGYFPKMKKRPGMSGYFTIASSLTAYFADHGPLSASELAEISTRECRRIFGQSPESPDMNELMALFAGAWNQLGRFLLQEHEGRFDRLIRSADGSAGKLVEILTRMPYFQDAAKYHGRDVYFLKRAQITAADLYLAFAGKGLGAFSDMDQLTLFADNLVPHVLRLDGILRYDPDLAARIDSEMLIEPGSPEEVEIRACALCAVERIVEGLHSRGEAVSAMQVDHLLWNRGQDPFYKKTKPRHRCRCVFY